MGGVYECSSKLGKLNKLSGGMTTSLWLKLQGSAASDERWHPTCNWPHQWIASSTLTNFPASTLLIFKYTSHTDYLNSQVWKCVTSCEQLKILHWDTSNEEDYFADFNLLHTPLANCKLEELILKDKNQECYIGNCMKKVLSQVKRLHLQLNLTWSQVCTLLNAAEATVEDLVTSGWEPADSNSSDDEDGGGQDKPYYWDMKKLKSFRAEYNPGMSNYHFKIKATQATVLHFGSIDQIDWIMLDSCRENLKELTMTTCRGQSGDQHEGELFNMPQLEHLHLILCHEKSHPHPEKSFIAFWDAIEKGITGRDGVSINEILPCLKSLKIDNDPMMKSKNLIKLVNYRAQIETLNVTFCEEAQIEEADCTWLNSAVPNFQCEKFDASKKEVAVCC